MRRNAGVITGPTRLRDHETPTGAVGGQRRYPGLRLPQRVLGPHLEIQGRRPRTSTSPFRGKTLSAGGFDQRSNRARSATLTCSRDSGERSPMWSVN